MNYAASDGGRRAAGIKEKADCTVRAFALLAGVPYVNAHAACGIHGRKSRCGFRKFQEKAPVVAKYLGFNLRLVRRKSSTVKRLLSDFPTGKLLVQIRCHAFAVIDGTVVDSFPPRPLSRVMNAWLVQDPAPICQTPEPEPENENRTPDVITGQLSLRLTFRAAD